MTIIRGPTVQVGTGSGLERVGSVQAHNATQMLCVLNSGNTTMRGRLLTVDLGTLVITPETDAEIFNDAGYRTTRVKLAQLSSTRHIVAQDTTISPFVARLYTIDVSGIVLTPNAVMSTTDLTTGDFIRVFTVDAATAVLCYVDFSSPDNRMKAIVLNISGPGVITEAATATVIDTIPSSDTNFDWWDVVQVNASKFSLLKTREGGSDNRYIIIPFERTGSTFNVGAAETVFTETADFPRDAVGWSQANDEMISNITRDGGVEGTYYLTAYSGIVPTTLEGLNLVPAAFGGSHPSLITTAPSRIMHASKIGISEYRVGEFEIVGTAVTRTALNNVSEFNVATSEGDFHIRPMQTTLYGMAMMWDDPQNPIVMALQSTELDPPPLPESGQISLSVFPSRQGKHVWMTAWMDGQLELRRWNTDDFEWDRIYEICPATFTEVTGRTVVAYCFAATDDLVYVFGRMNSPGGLSGEQHILVLDETQPTPAFVALVTGWTTDLAASLIVGFPFAASGVNRHFFAIRERAATASSMYHGVNNLDTESVLTFPIGTEFPHRGLAFNRAYDQVTIVALNRAVAPIAIQSDEPYAVWADVTENYPVPSDFRVVTYLDGNG